MAELLAYLLLTGWLDPSWCSWTPPVGNALRRICVRWEILDQRVEQHWFRNNAEFSNDLRIIHERLERATKRNYPPLADANRFPVDWVCIANYDTAREWSNKLGEELRFLDYPGRCLDEDTRADFLTDLKREADKIRDFWWTAMLLQDERQNYHGWRRELLWNLREQMGERDYYSGVLPPALPWWRFQEIR